MIFNPGDSVELNSLGHPCHGKTYEIEAHGDWEGLYHIKSLDGSERITIHQKFLQPCGRAGRRQSGGCECGAEISNALGHYDWCPKYEVRK